MLLLLQAHFRGYFVPPRPEKNAVEGQRMSDAFVEERRAGLQKYLQRLAAHPAIGRCEVRSSWMWGGRHARTLWGIDLQGDAFKWNH
jgi:hypothetical protein